jgi:hypothetical protein
LNRLPLKLSHVVRQGKEPVAVDVDGTVVMMSVARGNYYSVDDVAARIWRLLASPSTIASICDVLAEEYSVNREECAADVLEFLERLYSEGLIEVSDESLEPPREPVEG